MAYSVNILNITTLLMKLSKVKSNHFVYSEPISLWAIQFLFLGIKEAGDNQKVIKSAIMTVVVFSYQNFYVLLKQLENTAKPQLSIHDNN